MNPKHFITALLCFCLVSCSTTISKPKDCPASFEDYAYNGNTIDVIPLSPDWTKVDDIPFEVNKFSLLEIALIREFNNKTEIWLTEPDSSYYRNSDSENYKYYVYIVENKEWRTISAIVDGSNAFATRLILSKDGTIWSRNFWDEQNSVGNPYQRYPALSRFDENKQIFKFVPETQGIGLFLQLPSNKIIYSDNRIWIISQGAVYSYDPASSKVTRQIETPNLIIIDAAASKDDKYIYLHVEQLPLEQSVSLSIKNGEYLQYVLAENKLNTLSLPDRIWPVGPGGILIDHSGNLWISAIGWRSPDGHWQLIYPNPLLYFWKMQIEDDYSFQLPLIAFESSDGRLWFNREKGTAWLDPISMQGCWFTENYTSIAEDEGNSLWAVINHALYKLVEEQ